MKNFIFLLFFSLVVTQQVSATECPDLVRGGIMPFTSDMCKIEMETAKCSSYFAAHPEAKTFARNCDAGIREMVLDFASVKGKCEEGFGKSWLEWITGVFESIEKGVATGWSEYEKYRDRNEREKANAKICDETMGCKRMIAQRFGAWFSSKISDKELEATDTLHLLRRGELASRKRQAQLNLKSTVDFVSLPEKEKLNILAHATSKAHSEGEMVLRSLSEKVDSKLQQLGISFSCYNRSKQAELFCHTIGQVLSPDVVLPAAWGAKALRIAGRIEKEAGEIAKTMASSEVSSVASNLDSKTPSMRSLIKESKDRKEKGKPKQLKEPVAYTREASDSLLNAKLNSAQEKMDRHMKVTNLKSDDELVYWAEKEKPIKVQDPEIKTTAVNVFNRLNSPVEVKKYLTKLVDETKKNILSRNIPGEIELLNKGELSHNAVLRVLVQRAKKRGEKLGVMSGMDEAQFRNAVTNGPFFDLGVRADDFTRYAHGVESHLIQRDMVADVVERGVGSQRFYQYLGGSSDGGRLFQFLFDHGPGAGPNTFNSPTGITNFFGPVLNTR